jgi:hypothetical protein
MPLDPKTRGINEAGQGRCVDMSPRDDFAAVGMKDGSVRLYQTSDWKLISV